MMIPIDISSDSTVPIKENNEKHDPFYYLILMEKYGIQINLYGNDYAIDYPIHFLSNNVTGYSISITIDPIDRDRYDLESQNQVLIISR